jgi:hypothetical protein
MSVVNLIAVALLVLAAVAIAWLLKPSPPRSLR